MGSSADPRLILFMFAFQCTALVGFGVMTFKLIGKRESLGLKVIKILGLLVALVAGGFALLWSSNYGWLLSKYGLFVAALVGPASVSVSVFLLSTLIAFRYFRKKRYSVQI